MIIEESEHELFHGSNLPIFYPMAFFIYHLCLCGTASVNNLCSMQGEFQAICFVIFFFGSMLSRSLIVLNSGIICRLPVTYYCQE